MIQKKLKLEKGLIVRIKFYYDDEYPSFWDDENKMGKFMNKIVTIKGFSPSSSYENCYHIMEDMGLNGKGGFFWRDIDFQKVNAPCTKGY